MANILLWPDMYREQGHWLPAVNLAHSLIQAGHTVNFMGIADCQAIVAPYLEGVSQFFPILPDIYPPGHTVENDLEPIGQRWKPAHLLPIANGELDSVLDGAGPPDLLVSGFFNALETLLIHYRYNNLPFVTLTTYLRHPDETPDSFALSKLLYMQEPLVRKLIDTVTEPSSPDEALLPEDFVAPLAEVNHLELIPCPRELDFYDRDWDPDPERMKYVEPMLERVTFATGSAPPAPDVHWPVPPESTDGPKIIFGTSGSQVGDYEDKAREYFRALIAMMSTYGMEKYHLVLAMGEKLFTEFSIEYGLDENNESEKLPSNVTLSSWVSQLDVLDRASVVFMHGGLATIKEAIWKRVPIVILPHGKDQMENALRLERNGVALLPETQNPNATELKRLMSTAIASPWMKTNLERLGKIFDAMENASPPSSVGIINSLLP